MTRKKVDGKPCIRCGETIRFQKFNGVKEITGDCVNCKQIAKTKERSARTKREEASIGISEPYKRCYEQGYLAAGTERVNPYPVSELGKRCAWQAGFNDNTKQEGEK